MTFKQETKIASDQLVIATSGHIDHGKTSLVKAITGIDTDRFKEEKRRGITIDIGFAHFSDSRGKKIAFVDVPGHEKFIHNMLAGMSGIDAVLLVVAADKGVMPQTREHLNICNLLKINDGLVVLTRIDLVEESGMVQLCKEEVYELVKGTFLEGKSIIPVSSTKGYGIEELKEEFSKLFNKNQSMDFENPFRLYVDRSFTLKGFGTVVTGTVLSGSVRLGEDINVLPKDVSIRIRSIQTNGQKTDMVHVGQRAALNLGGIKADEIKRGDQLVKPKSLLTSYIINTTFLLLKDISNELKNRTRIRVYFGSREVIGRILLLDGSVLFPGEYKFVQIRLESMVSTKFGDRFVIRSYSPITTLGGGMVVDPSPSKSRRINKSLPQRIMRLNDLDPNVRSEEVIYLQSVRGVIESEFSIRSGLSIQESRKVFKFLMRNKKIFCVDNKIKRYLHEEHINRVSRYLIRILEFHHKKFFDRKGMTSAEIAGKFIKIFNEIEVENILNYLVNNRKFKKNGEFFHLLDHQQQFSQNQEKNISKCIVLISAGGFQPMRQTRLLEELNLSEKDGIIMLKKAIYTKRLLNVANDLYYTPEKIEEILDNLSYYFHNNKNISVIQFKELLNISRKYAIDLLEYFDGKRLTIREENQRIPGTILVKDKEKN